MGVPEELEVVAGELADPVEVQAAQEAAVAVQEEAVGAEVPPAA